MKEQLVMKHDKVLVKPIDESEQLYGSIIVPDLGKEKPQIGEVIAVGPGRTSEFGAFINISVEVGDKVLVPKIGVIRFDFDGDEYYILPDREILGVIK